MENQNVQKTKISYAMNNVMYDNCGHTFESFLAFQGVHEWKTREHLVFYNAEMKRRNKAVIMPTSPHWRLTAKIVLVDAQQFPSSKNILFDNITEVEARNWLKLFQEQSNRLSAFKKEYYKSKKKEIERVEIERFIMGSNGEDPFIQHSLELQKNSGKVHPFPTIMMTEQVLASREYNPGSPTVLSDDEEDQEGFIYNPNETANWDIVCQNLKEETAETIVSELSKADQVTQIISLYKHQKNYFLPTEENLPKDKRCKIRPFSELEDCFEFFYFNGLELTKFFETGSCVEAVKVGSNLQKGYISPAQKAVKAHELIKGTYNSHFDNFSYIAESFDERKALAGINFGFN